VTKPNPENCKNSSAKCAYDCAHLQYTIRHRTVLIIFPLTSRQDQVRVYSPQIRVSSPGQLPPRRVRVLLRKVDLKIDLLMELLITHPVPSCLSSFSLSPVQVQLEMDLSPSHFMVS